MSITAETAKAHAKDPAVLCCRAEAGITIEAANLEDPAIFDDLVDSGLLNLDGALTIEQVLGAKLIKTCDSLCPLTADVLEGVKAAAVEEVVEEEEVVEPKIKKMIPRGVVLLTYIVAENEDGMYLIDQHAAAERINYEKIMLSMGITFRA